MMDRYQPEQVHVIVPESTALDVNADRLVKDADPESLFSMACELDPVKSSDPIASAVMAYVRARADSRLPDCECAGCGCESPTFAYGAASVMRSQGTTMMYLRKSKLNET